MYSSIYINNAFSDNVLNISSSCISYDHADYSLKTGSRINYIFTII